MRFDFDPAKSRANRAKHGIDFNDAQALWNDPERLERPAYSTTEPRSQVIGRINSIAGTWTLWSAFITYRHDPNSHETICRIISVRKTRRSEQIAYFERDAASTDS